jgi:Protein of unknown function (DUF3175)
LVNGDEEEVCHQSEKMVGQSHGNKRCDDFAKSIFTKSPHAIALSLKRSAEKSHRRKSGPFRSAMSMLNFYINRAGKNLTTAQRNKLDTAKDELRKVFHRK